ncbi:MAG: SOS response-associated peptidase [Rhodospirillales bacterium]
MCSRYEINARPAEVSAHFGLGAAADADFEAALPAVLPRAEVRPTDPALTITSEGAQIMRWGWRTPHSAQPLINARAETLEEKPTFRPHLGARCAVPATAYFEWRRSETPPVKRRNRIYPAAGGLIAFAALHDGEGRVVIITTAPAAAVAHIHNRMPVILPDAGRAAWLSARPFTEAWAALAAAETAETAPGLNLRADEDTPPQTDLFGG